MQKFWKMVAATYKRTYVGHGSAAMNTNIWLTLVLLLATSMARCQGKLGDSEAQCLARYGAEFDVQDNLGFDVVGDRAASFHLQMAAGSFVLNVTFLNGAAALEKFTSVDSSRDISEEQKKTILDSEGAGLAWSEKATTYRTDRSDVTSGMQGWLRSDGAAATCWMSGKLTLHHGWSEIDISTRQYAAAQRSLDQQDGAR
jgi:hypothetical protein